MISKNRLYFSLMTIIFLCAFPIHIASSQERTHDISIEEQKEEILKNIQTIELGLSELKACISMAKTPAELERCREEIKMRKYLEVQDMLLEMGMSREERKMRRPPQ